MATLIGAATYRAPLIQTPRARHSETIYYNKQNAIIKFFYYFPKIHPVITEKAVVQVWPENVASEKSNAISWPT